jgi:PIN domain nuclease of toxin-antitoxin system
MTTALLDTHVLYWWTSEPRRLSPAATRAVTDATELAVASISWFELAWLAQHGRISCPMPIRAWLQGIAEDVRTVGLTAAIATTAVSLPQSFPNDPADRLIYATAIEQGWPLVTKDQRIHVHRHPGVRTIW